MYLKNGSNGPDVEKLQEKLGIDSDGNFGTNTENKVKEFQRQNGLDDDGVVGNDTWNKLFNISVVQPVSVGNLKFDKLKGVIPDVVLSQIPDTCSKFNINTPLRLSHFLSQCAHESGKFTLVSENLNYSADRMIVIFKRDFDRDNNKVVSQAEKQKAISLVGNPKGIGNFVYANQNGNGDESSGDGYRFRGRGYIQLTGRENYTKFDKLVDDDILSDPDLVASKYALSSAAFFFDSKKLWGLCDAGSSDDHVKKLTYRVNGGYNGLETRKEYFHKFYNLLK